MKKAFFAFLFGLIVIGGYRYVTYVEIGPCSMHAGKLLEKQITIPYEHRSTGRLRMTYECVLRSKIDQDVKMGIAVDDAIERLRINAQPVDLAQSTRRYAGYRGFEQWKHGDTFWLTLKRGENRLRIEGRDRGGKFGLRIGQGMGYVEYLLLFIFGAVPLVYGVYVIVFPLFVKSLRNIYRLRSIRWQHLPYVIIGLGIVLRIAYLVDVPNRSYQHDMQGHIDAIHYFAQHPTDLPQPDKSLQFPQQPLYYYVAAAVYSFSKAMGLNEHDAVYSLRVMSLVFSVAWLFIGLLLVRLYTKRTVSVNMFMAFLAFTPSFVFLSAAVNNDALNALLGSLALYGISAYFHYGTRCYFATAVIAVLLAMATKISSVLYALFFVLVLVVVYFRDVAMRPRIQREILWFGLSVLLIFGFALVKSYIPANGEFRFVNSGLYGGQIIPAFGLEYFFSFHFLDLLQVAQSYVLGADTVRFSLPTYMYGTMLMGEFDYSRFFSSGTLFRLSSQLLLLFGSIYVVGWGAYGVFFWRMNAMQKLLVVPVAINFLLIVKFLLAYWVVCNTDFRYFTPTFAAIGLMAILGLQQLGARWRRLQRPIVWMVVGESSFAIAWTLNLIHLN